MPFFAMAADDDFVGPPAPKYTLLESLPSAGDGDLSNDVTLSEYLGWLFKFALVMAGFLAVLMITVGGIIYMASGGNESQITKAKERINNALWGLLLAFASYLLLYTINPQLVSFKFIDTLENYEVTSSNSENSGSGSSNSESSNSESSDSESSDSESIVVDDSGGSGVGVDSNESTYETYTNSDGLEVSSEETIFTYSDGTESTKVTETYIDESGNMHTTTTEEDKDGSFTTTEIIAHPDDSWDTYIDGVLQDPAGNLDGYDGS